MTAANPLDRLTADEIVAARLVLEKEGLVGPATRLAYLGLEEPPKAQVLAFRPGEAVDRRVRAILLDVATGATSDVVASLTRAAVDRRTDIDPASGGHAPILLEDLMAVDEIVKSDPGWVAAMARRGVTDLDSIQPCPLSAGDFGIEGERGRRMLRVLSFVRNRPTDHCWAHPVDGLAAWARFLQRRDGAGPGGW